MSGQVFTCFARDFVLARLPLRRPSFVTHELCDVAEKAFYFLCASPRAFGLLTEDHSTARKQMQYPLAWALALSSRGLHMPLSTPHRCLQSPQPAHRTFAGGGGRRIATRGVPSSRGCFGWSPTPVALVISPLPPPPPTPTASFDVGPGCWLQEVSVLLPDEAELDRASEDEGGAEISPGVTLRTLRNSG